MDKTMDRIKDFLGNRILCIAPHCDDEILGCGGTLIKLSRDPTIELGICVLTKPLGNADISNQRLNEFDKVADKIKCVCTYKAGFEDACLDLYKKDIIAYLESILTKFRPTTLLIPARSFHQDHTAAFDCCIAAVRPTYRYDVSVVLEYDTVEISWNGGDKHFHPNLYIGLTKEDLEEKIELLNYYKSVNNHIGFSMLKGHALRRGLECSEEFAESFRLIRGKVC